MTLPRARLYCSRDRECGGAGIARRADVAIDIHVYREARRLHVDVRNPAPSNAGIEGNRHAQDSIAQRLAYHFGNGVRISRLFEDGIYQCRIELPLP